MFQGFESQIHIQIFPAEIAAVNEPDVFYLGKTGILKPGELVLRQKMFLPSHKEPDSAR